MPTHIALVNWTDQGIRSVSAAVERADKGAEIARKQGARFLERRRSDDVDLHPTAPKAVRNITSDYFVLWILRVRMVWLRKEPRERAARLE